MAFKFSNPHPIRKYVSKEGALIYVFPSQEGDKHIPAQRFEWEKVYGKGSLKDKQLVCKTNDRGNPHPSNWRIQNEKGFNQQKGLDHIRVLNGMQQIKVSLHPITYKWLHHVLWEEKYGPIPNDHRLFCKSGDPMNEHPDNWELRPYKEYKVGDERYVAQADTTYVKIKMPDFWKAKHLVVWERRHGPIKKGWKVIFIDGDRQNFDLKNLRCVSPEEYHASVNKDFRLYPEKLRALLLATHRLDKLLSKK